ncbi:MAG: NAD-dependent epimerase/dehydratase family protein, partial [Lentisphaerota bacterium]
MRVLVTGAKGFAGQHTVRHLVENGHKVFQLDLRAAIPQDTATEFGGDLTHPEILRQ